MKKVSLIAMAAMIAVSSQAMANMEDPMYLPQSGQIYSKTMLYYDHDIPDAQPENTTVLAQEFGYGINSKLAVHASTEYFVEVGNDSENMEDLELGLTYRLVDRGMMWDVKYNYVLDTTGENGEDDAEMFLATELGKNFGKLTLAVEVNYTDYVDSSTSKTKMGYWTELQYRFDNKWSINLASDIGTTEEDGQVDVDEDKTYLQVNYSPSTSSQYAWFMEMNNEATDNEMAMGLKADFEF